MARRSIRKRRYFMTSEVLADRIRESILHTMLAYDPRFNGGDFVNGLLAGRKTGKSEQLHQSLGEDTVTFVPVWEERYSSSPDEKPSETMTVVSVDKDAGTFTVG